MNPLSICFLVVATLALAAAGWLWSILLSERRKSADARKAQEQAEAALESTLQRHEQYSQYRNVDEFAAERAAELNRQKAEADALTAKAKEYARNTKAKATQLIEDGQRKHEELIQAATSKADSLAAAARSEEARIAQETEQLTTIHDGLKQEINALRNELGLARDSMDLVEYGWHIPEYEYDAPDDYKRELDAVRAQQKDMIKSDDACPCRADWTVEGSRAKGRRMIQQHQKLALRAFNGEAEACLASVKHSNVDSCEKRLRRSFDAVNKFGKEKKIEISEVYFDLKRAELVLKYEWEVAKQKEKEEQKAIRDRIREEERAQRELEKAQQLAEKEVRDTEKALEKARTELLAKHEAMAEKNAAEVEKLQAIVDKLEGEYASVLDKKARAISRAQLTRSGYVYILSNIGAFGEEVFKIGLTRRLNPEDRVSELSGAAVPFPFDVHAMIYSEDAPALESALHNYFAHRRVNLANSRKEFFHVTIDEIEQAFAELHGDMTKFRRIPDAEQYRETLARRREEEQAQEQSKSRLPRSFFAEA